MTETGKRKDGEKTLYSVLGLNPCGKLRPGRSFELHVPGMAWAAGDRKSISRLGGGGRAAISSKRPPLQGGLPVLAMVG